MWKTPTTIPLNVFKGDVHSAKTILLFGSPITLALLRSKLSILKVLFPTSSTNAKDVPTPPTLVRGLLATIKSTLPMTVKIELMPTGSLLLLQLSACLL